MARKTAKKLDTESKKLLDGLFAKLRLAIPQTFETLTKEFPDICGFAVATTAYIEFVVPTFQRTCELDENDPFGYDRFSPAEWAATNATSRKDNFGSEVDLARTKLCQHCDSLDLDDSCNVRVAFLSGLPDLLVELDKEMKLGLKTDERFLTIWIAGDDEESLIEASRKLNTKGMHKKVLNALS